MTSRAALSLDVVVPVYNEQSSLDRSIRVLHATLGELFDEPWRITIADNASTDDTLGIAQALAAELPAVSVLHLDEKGRGRALKRAWLDSEAEVVAYVDVDLSTDLRALPPLVASLLSGHSDIAIGTRLGRGSRVVRGAKREFVSRSYNLILRLAMGVTFTDAQCGFKAMRREVAQRILPLVEDTGWFFDSELLIVGERAGLRIHEVPVDWIDDEHSSVDVVATAAADLRGLMRVGRSILGGRIPFERIYAELGRQPFAPARPPSFFGQVVRFGAIGIASTIAYALLYLLFERVVVEQLANFLALLATAIANTWANRRFTFGVRGPSGLLKHHVQGLVVFAAAWGITAGTLALLHSVRPDASAHLELAALTAANLTATVVRFVMLRLWVFRSRASLAPDAPERRVLTSRDRVLSS
jgi:glycosyltransferase involved in cell wall biosynthesis